MSLKNEMNVKRSKSRYALIQNFLPMSILMSLLKEIPILLPILKKLPIITDADSD